MHEGALAKSIIEIILDTALANKAKEVVRVEIEVGEICLVNIDQLTYLIKIMASDTIARNMTFQIKELHTLIKCKVCSYVGEVEYKEVEPEWHYRVPLFGCIRCKSNKTEIIQGRDLMVRSIEIK
jgi:hydrogenase nickel incorporation protein HypA/HybF